MATYQVTNGTNVDANLGVQNTRVHFCVEHGTEKTIVVDDVHALSVEVQLESLASTLGAAFTYEVTVPIVNIEPWAGE